MGRSVGNKWGKLMGDKGYLFSKLFFALILVPSLSLVIKVVLFLEGQKETPDRG